MDTFESHVLDHWHDIFTLLVSDANNYNQGQIPNKISYKLCTSLYSMSKSIKISSFQAILNNNKLIQTNIFNSCIEYNNSSSFIQNDLIPMIINYETDKTNMISDIQNSIEHKINKCALNIKHSVFTKLGWIELMLFCLCNICSFLSCQYLKFYFSLTLLLFYLFHVIYAIKTFQQRRIICYYLNCLSKHKNLNGHNLNYTAYILEGFNICNISLLSSNTSLKLNSCNKIDSYIATISSLKYLFGIIYCIASINNYIGFLLIIHFPVIFGVATNIDSIFAEFNKSKYKYLINQCNQMFLGSTSLKNDIKKNEKVEGKMANYFEKLCFYVFQCLFYWILSLCLVLLLFTIVVGIGIMCDIQSEFYNNIWFGAMKDWTLFVSVKISFVVPVILIIDYFQCDSDQSLDIENSLFFISLASVSNIVLCALCFGINSWITDCFVIIGWITLYIYIMVYCIQSITHDAIKDFQWICLFKLKWINSHLAQTKMLK